MTEYVHFAKQMTNVITAEKLRLLQDPATEANVMKQTKVFGLMPNTQLDIRHGRISPESLKFDSHVEDTSD